LSDGKPGQKKRPVIVSHGARSKVQKRADVKRIERAVAMQNGVQLRQMTGTQRRYLRLYAESLRLVDRLDAIGDDGNVSGNAPTYLAAVNAAGRSLERFEVAMGHSRKQRDQNELLDELARYRGGTAS
jgi:hypothetical protein